MMNFSRRVFQRLPLTRSRVALGLVGVGGGGGAVLAYNHYDSASSAASSKATSWPLGRPTYASTVGDHKPGVDAGAGAGETIVDENRKVTCTQLSACLFCRWTTI